MSQETKILALPFSLTSSSNLSKPLDLCDPSLSVKGEAGTGRGGVPSSNVYTANLLRRGGEQGGTRDKLASAHLSKWGTHFSAPISFCQESQRSWHGTFSKQIALLGSKTSLNKFKKIKVIPCIFSDHNAMKLEINHKKKSGKSTNTRRLNNTLLNGE